MSKNLSELSGREGLANSLFQKYGDLAQETGTPDVADLDKLANEFLIGKANTYGAVTFYDFLKPENKGKKVYVCNGTACLCAGTQDALSQKIKTHFKAKEIGHITCLGRCHENSAFQYQGKNYSGNVAENLETIFQNHSTVNNDDNYLVKAHGKQILTQAFSDVQTYYQPFLAALNLEPKAVLEEIKISNIRGRGGAGFPMGLKLQFCRNEESEVKFIICNADEGDPGAYSDRYLLEKTATFRIVRYVGGRICDKCHAGCCLHSCRISGIRKCYPKSDRRVA